MQKKNVLTMALSVSLVGVIAVGGTLAYLTSTTGPVTNTFTGSAGITMTLDEAKVGENGQVIVGQGAARVTGNTYNNILPGVEYDKDPTVHITQVPSQGVDVYVVINGLEDVNDLYTVDVDVNNNLELVEGYTNLYKFNRVVTPDMMTDAEVQKKYDILVFDGIKFDYDNEDVKNEKFDIEDVTVKAYAVQTGLTPADLEDSEYDTVDEMAAAALGATAVTVEPGV